MKLAARLAAEKQAAEAQAIESSKATSGPPAEEHFLKGQPSVSVGKIKFKSTLDKHKPPPPDQFTVKYEAVNLSAAEVHKAPAQFTFRVHLTTDLYTNEPKLALEHLSGDKAGQFIQLLHGDVFTLQFSS